MRILAGAIFLGIALFVFITPMLRLVWMSFRTEAGLGLGNYCKLMAQPRTSRAIVNTVVVAVGATLISVFLGAGSSFLVACTDVRRKRLVEMLTLAPFVIPSYITTLSWSSFLSRRGWVNRSLTVLGLPMLDVFSMGGIILVLGICNAPVVYLNTMHMLRRVPRELEWASLASGRGVWETFFRISLPQVMPALIAGGVLAFLAAIDNFSVPAFLGIPAGIPVLSTYIYENIIGFGPSSFNLAAALSVMLSVIAITGSFLQGRLIKKTSGMESIAEDRSVRVPLGCARGWVEGGAIFFLLTLTIVPLLAMVSSAFLPNYKNLALENITLKNFAFVFTNRGVRQAVVCSLQLASLTVLICLIAGTAIAWLRVRRGSAVIRIVEVSSMLTYAMPGIVLALSMIFHWTMFPGVYGTLRILLIAYVTRYLILQIKGSAAAVTAVNVSLEEAALVYGGGMVRVWVQVILPLIARSALASAFMIFAYSFTELTLSSILASAGARTVGLTVFSLQQAGDTHLSAAMSTVIVFAVLIFYLLSIVLRALGKRPRRKGAGEP